MAPKSKRQKTTQSSFSVEESDWEKFASALLGSKYGHIYCEQLGISLAPGDSDSLYQWLCCSILMSSGLSEKLTTRVRMLWTSSKLCTGRSRSDAALIGMSCPWMSPSSYQIQPRSSLVSLSQAGKVLLESGLLKDPATCKQSAHNKFVGYLDHKFQRSERCDALFWPGPTSSG